MSIYILSRLKTPGPDQSLLSTLLSLGDEIWLFYMANLPVTFQKWVRKQQEWRDLIAIWDTEKKQTKLVPLVFKGRLKYHCCWEGNWGPHKIHTLIKLDPGKSWLYSLILGSFLLSYTLCYVFFIQPSLSVSVLHWLFTILHCLNPCQQAVDKEAS